MHDVRTSSSEILGYDPAHGPFWLDESPREAQIKCPVLRGS